MAKSDKKEGAAKVAKASSPEPEYNYTVSKRFKDKNDSAKTYAVGDSVNRFGAERLEDLVKRGLVQKTEVK